MNLTNVVLMSKVYHTIEHAAFSHFRTFGQKRAKTAVSLRFLTAKMRPKCGKVRKCGKVQFSAFLYLRAFRFFSADDGAAVLLRARKFRPRFRVFSG